MFSCYKQVTRFSSLFNTREHSGILLLAKLWLTHLSQQTNKERNINKFFSKVKKFNKFISLDPHHRSGRKPVQSSCVHPDLKISSKNCQQAKICFDLLFDVRLLLKMLCYIFWPVHIRDKSVSVSVWQGKAWLSNAPWMDNFTTVVKWF